MLYSKLNTTRDGRKPKDVMFSDTYIDGTEKDVLLRFLNKYDDRDEIDIEDISKLIAISALNVKYKLRGKGIKHYLSPRTINGRLRRTINRASIAQIKEIVHDRTINKEFRGELLDFLDDRVTHLAQTMVFHLILMITVLGMIMILKKNSLIVKSKTYLDLV